MACLLPLGAPAAPAPDIPVDTIFETVQTRSVHRNQTAWREVEPAFRSRIAQAVDEEAILQAFVFLFQQMGDVHSQLIYRGRTYNHFEGVDEATAQKVRPLMDAARTQTGNIDARTLDGGYAYLRIPSLPVFGTEAITQAAQDLHDRVCELAQSAPRGGVVDLRLNSGGNMLPMLAGLAPLFGPGVVGGAFDADQRAVHEWSIRDHDLWIDGQRMTRTMRPCRADLAAAPVAVLLGPITMSSGAAVAIAFKGRPRTHFVGEPTARGYTTGNDWIPLTPNLVLNLATTWMADRNGTAYAHQVLPDAHVTGTDAFDDLPSDAKVRAAIDWLKDR